ncbi:MAG: MFS transporter [Burkholderiales bacterium]
MRSPNDRILPLVVACPLFLQNLDTSVMTTALPVMSTALRVPVLDLNLAITAYLLSLAVFLPVSGWLADRFGAKRVFCAAIVLFALGSALCGSANTLPQLVLFRIVQGVGGAMMVPVGRLILLRSVPANEMMRAMVWFTIPPVIGRLLGPLAGGVIVSVTSWQWIFLVNIPFGLLGLALALRYVDADPPAAEAARPQPFDLLGFLLLACGLSGVLCAVETAGKALVPAAVTWTVGLAGAAALGGYLRHSRRRAEPLIDLGILRHPTYRASVLGGTPLRIALGAAPFLLPLLLQLGFGLTPLQSGLLTMATAIGSLGTRAVVVRAIRRFGFRTLLMGSTLLAALFMAGYGLFTPATPHPLMFGVMVLGGLFSAMALVSLATLGYSEIPPQRMSHATALTNIAQQLSISAGVVMGASLLTLASVARGGQAHALQASDFNIAFLVIGALTLISAAAFSRLRDEHGEALRGR